MLRRRRRFCPCSDESVLMLEFSAHVPRVTYERDRREVVGYGDLGDGSLRLGALGNVLGLERLG